MYSSRHHMGTVVGFRSSELTSKTALSCERPPQASGHNLKSRESTPETPSFETRGPNPVSDRVVLVSAADCAVGT